MSDSKFQRERMQPLLGITAELTDLRHIQSIMSWDQEVMIPPAAAGDRANQFATLSAIVHQKATSDELRRALEAAEDAEELNDAERGLCRVMRRAYDMRSKFPEAFVVEEAQLVSSSLPVWATARAESDFSQFAPKLEALVDLNRRKADYLGYTDHPYDALLDVYEEGLTTVDTATMFDTLKGPVSSLLQAAAGRGEPFVPNPAFEETDQVAYSKVILKTIGYDFDRGREDKSAHPFSTTLGHNDRRVTNRYSVDGLDFIFSGLHEGGHALYEMGISDALARTALDSGVSLGIHESQSRLWENIIGRSAEFWEGQYEGLQSAFPEQLGEMGVSRFVESINYVSPSFIRVEADEVSYNLHVLVRFELEVALIEGSLSVSELPEAWNAKYKEYIGVDVDCDANGVLQDIHWSHGSFGYFPTYTMGNLGSAQFWNAYKDFDPGYRDTIRKGDFSKIRDWLTAQIYQYGSTYTPKQLFERVTGESLNARYFIDYLNEKFQG